MNQLEDSIKGLQIIISELEKEKNLTVNVYERRQIENQVKHLNGELEELLKQKGDL